MTILTDEEAPFFTIGETAGSSVLITVEHASNAVPLSLSDLGLGQEALGSHIAYDILAKDFAFDLARKVEGTVVGGNFSRLVVDCNRLANSSSLIKVESDQIIIPRNQNLSQDEKNQRFEEIYQPYHQELERLTTMMAPSLMMISIHSFTPRLMSDQIYRIWDFGILWDQDDRLARSLGTFVDARYPALIFDYNVPYDLRIVDQGSLHIHAYPYGIPAIEIELNQKGLADPTKYNMMLSAFVDFIKHLNIIKKGPDFRSF